jgi:hypothetical protein
MAARIESYKQLADRYIPEQYKASEHLRGVLDSLMVQADALEAALWEIFESLNLETAIGPALDFFGAVLGVERKPGETDEAYRARIYAFRSLQDAPTYEGVREALKLFMGRERVELYPCWPAGMYFVIDGDVPQEIPEGLYDYFTAGVDVGAGTFLIAEYGEPYGYIISEDTGMPFVIDQRWPDTLYELVDSNGDYLVDSEGNHLVALDYLTT